MVIFLGFFLPLVAYLALYVWLGKKQVPTGLLSMLLAAAIALWSAAWTLGVVFWSPEWRDSAQIAWTGVEASNKPMVIGGAREEAIVGWPNGAFSPKLTVAAANNQSASLEIANGLGFVFDENSKQFLNGEVIKPDETKTLDDYSLKHSTGWFGKHYFEFFKDGKSIAKFSLTTAKTKVFALETQLERSATEYGSSVALFNLQRWASGIRLLLTEEGEVRILERQMIYKQNCDMPCKLKILWTTLHIPFEVRKESEKIILNFPPPWRLASPIPAAKRVLNEPPANSNTPTKNSPSASGNKNSDAVKPEVKTIPLTITSCPRPNDIAFVLPFGQGLNDSRTSINLLEKSGFETIFQTGVVDTRDDLRDAVPEKYLPNIKKGEVSGMTSTTAARTGPYSFLLATVKDLPGMKKTAWLMSLAFLSFCGGLILVYARMREQDLWMIYGLMTVLWDFLAFRLLLAFRYTLDPSRLDGLAVSGVTTALVGLAVAPGLILFGCRLRRDLSGFPADEKYRKRALLWAGGYLGFIFLIFLYEYATAPTLWQNLPTRYVPSLHLVFKIFAGMVFLFLFLAVFATYGTVKGKKGYRPEQTLFVGVWSFLVERLSDAAKKRWETLAVANHMKWAMRIAYLIFGVLVAVVIWGVIPAAMSLIPTVRKSFQEIIAPLLFCWPVAVFWLSSKRVFTPDEQTKRPNAMNTFFWAFVTLLPPVFLLPLAIRDVGSIMGALSIFVSVVVVLLASKSRYCGWVALVTLVSGFLLASFVYVETRTMIPGLFGEAEIRLLNFREESAVQDYILFANSVKGEDPTALPVQKLRNAYQHTWENKAIAHVGGWFGLPFGKAPAERSQVRLDTIEYDSVFSFFILSEHGVIGSLFLLLLYAMPLTIILFVGRQRFEMGKAVAAVIAGAFLLEGLIHAAMNLNALPFTGRDLPLLAINSVSDLMRWTILFGLATMTVFWRYDGAGKEKPEALSVISSNFNATGNSASNPPSENLPRYVMAAIVIAIIPLFMIGYIIFSSLTIVYDSRLDEPFGWDEVLENVQKMARLEILKVNQQDKTIFIDPTKLPVSQGMLLSEEVKRFNALPPEERDEETYVQGLMGNLNRVKDFGEYNKILEEAKNLSLQAGSGRRPSIFKIVRSTQVDEEGNVTKGDYRVEPNPDFNVRLSFTAGNDRADIPQVTLRNAGDVVIGSAWVMGRWILATNYDAPLPWSANLAAAINSETSRLGAAEEANQRYGTLSLDKNLQLAAINFAALKGRGLFDSLLKATPPVTPTTNNKTPIAEVDEARIPPRVALAIVNLSGDGFGETLALGGWPKITSDLFWKKESFGTPGQVEWIPPGSWVENEAPRFLRTRYEGDRNFDRIIMGSTTKPIWATAVLGVHPGLDQRLRVGGSDALESDVFGINLARQWKVTPNVWRDFNSYLTFSDNRYEVRLGFLGLAEKSGNEVATESAISPSKKESMNASTTAWQRYPKFPNLIGFSKDQQRELLNLHQTPLALNLRNMYGVGLTHNEMRHKISFWTKNEADNYFDVAQNRKNSPTRLFRWISPLAPNFELDQVNSPEAFVTLLLGGGTNLWANVDFAAAFGACVTGTPVVAHIVRNQREVELTTDRKPFPDIAGKIRAGLAGVVTQGTARAGFQSTGAKAFLSSLNGVEVYAKTGTLKADDQSRDTSRIVVALIKWNAGKTAVRKGLVFSLVAEQARRGTATLWLGEFFTANQVLIRQWLND